MKIPQIDYTSRDYLTLKDDLVKVVQNRIPEWQANEESDFTLALVEAFAYLGDNLSYYMDRAANEGSLQSATQLQNILNFAEVSGYHVSGPSPAYISLTFTNTSGSTLTLPTGTQVRGHIDTDTFSEVYFETAAPITALANGASATVTAFEGYVSNTLSSAGLDTNNLPLPVTLGTASGYAYEELVLPETGIVDLSVSVYTGQSSSFTKWTYVSNIAEYGPLDRVFTTRINADTTLSVLFGDGVNGKIPEVGTPVSALYRVSIGSYGNISLTSPSLKNPDGTSALTVTYIPGTSLSGVASLVTVTPISDAIGGTNGDMQAPYYGIRNNVRKALKTKNRAVTLKDYEDLSVLVPRVGRAAATSSVYTSVNLYVQPLNDGSATPGRDSSGNELTTIFNPIRAAVQSFIGTRCPVNTTLNINPPTYVPIYLHITVYIKDGFSQSSTQLDIGNILLNNVTGLFSYNGYAFGEDVVMSAITYDIMRHPAVSNVIINGLGKISSGYQTTSITGASGLSTITVGSNTGLVAGQLVYGTGIAAGTKISSVSGTTINLTNANISAVSGTGTFFTSSPADIPIAASEIPSLTSTYTTIVMSGGIS